MRVCRSKTLCWVECALHVQRMVWHRRLVRRRRYFQERACGLHDHCVCAGGLHLMKFIIGTGTGISTWSSWRDSHTTGRDQVQVQSLRLLPSIGGHPPWYSLEPARAMTRDQAVSVARDLAFCTVVHSTNGSNLRHLYRAKVVLERLCT